MKKNLKCFSTVEFQNKEYIRKKNTFNKSFAVASAEEETPKKLFIYKNKFNLSFFFQQCLISITQFFLKKERNKAKEINEKQ